MVLDHTYFAEGVRRCEGPLKAYLRRKTGAPHEEVDELHQVILARAWEKRSEFTGGDLSSWLYHFAAFAALAWHRARGRRMRAAEAFTSHTELLDLTSMDGEALQIRRQELRQLQSCLEGLSAADRCIIDLYYGRGGREGPGKCLGDREIAEHFTRELGETWKIDRVTKRRARALDHLSRCLEGESSPAEEFMPDARRRSPLFDLVDGTATGVLNEETLAQRLRSEAELRKVWRRLTYVELLLLAEDPPATALRLVPRPGVVPRWVGGILSLAAGLALVVGLSQHFKVEPVPRVLERGSADVNPEGEGQLVVRYQAGEGPSFNVCPQRVGRGRWVMGVVPEGILQVGVPAPEGLPLDGPWSVVWRLTHLDQEGGRTALDVGKIETEGLGTDRWLYPRDLRLQSLMGLGFEVGDTLAITMDRGGDMLELEVTLMDPDNEEERWWPACSDLP